MYFSSQHSAASGIWLSSFVTFFYFWDLGIYGDVLDDRIAQRNNIENFRPCAFCKRPILTFDNTRESLERAYAFFQCALRYTTCGSYKATLRKTREARSWRLARGLYHQGVFSRLCRRLACRITFDWLYLAYLNRNGSAQGTYISSTSRPLP